MITLWGPSSSGKTALLSYLYLKSQAVKSGWHIFPTSSSLAEVIRQSNQIRKANEFPIGTLTTNEREISYDFKDLETGLVSQLETKDRAGLRSEAMDEEILSGLAASDGIVLFLDYGRGHRETEVVDALSQMYVQYSKKMGTTAQKDTRPLAVCLSKVDQLIRTPEDLKQLQDNMEQFVRDKLSTELLGWIDQYHEKVKFFPVSSVGLRLSYGCIWKSVFYDERLVLRVTDQGTPINIVEPFAWIFKALHEGP